MVLNSQQPLNITIGEGDTSNFGVFNLWDVLRVSSFFDNYAGMYDQVKMDSVRIRLTGSWQEQSSDDQAKRIIPTVTTAFDRNGFLDGALPAEAAVLAYSSAMAKPWSLGSAFSQTRSLYTSTMQEKSQYIPTSSLKNPIAPNNTCANPCWNGSCISCPFKPIYIVHGSLPTAATRSATTLHFTVEFDICVTFRGLRKRASAYDGVDFYSLLNISVGGSVQTVTDAYAVDMENPIVEFDSAGMLLAYAPSSAGTFYFTGATFVETDDSIDFSGVFTTGIPVGYVFFEMAEAAGNMVLTFRENEGAQSIQFNIGRGSFVNGEWTYLRLPTPPFAITRDWYTPDSESINN